MPSPLSIFVIDPPQRLDPPTDTSLALMRESLRRGHRVFYCTPEDLRLEGGTPRGRVRAVNFPPRGELFESGEELDLDLRRCSVLYMRKDPPTDLPYLNAAAILDRIDPRVLQINPPRALRLHNEKLIPGYFPGLLPESVVTRSASDLRTFLHKEKKIVVKPLDDCSGRGIFVVEEGEARIEERLEEAVAAGRFVQGQRFLPEILGRGDKRVLLLGGEILGWVRREPAAGDFRSNVNAGGRCVPCDLTAEDREICARIGRWLAREEIHLAGIDIVGRHVLEVNITSPSCLREMNALTSSALERRVLDYVEARISEIPE